MPYQGREGGGGGRKRKTFFTLGGMERLVLRRCIRGRKGEMHALR